jgi:hypothetical protein
VGSNLTIQELRIVCWKARTTDAQRGNSRKVTATPKFLGMAELYFVCQIGPIFQISLVYAFIGCPQSATGKDKVPLGFEL